jgi:hypothetical protein
MKPAFHYLLKANILRKENVDYKEEREFRNENPILARQEALEYFEYLIDLMLRFNNEKYTTDSQARKSIKSFINLKTYTQVKIAGKEYNMNDSFGYGIGIFLIIDNPIDDSYKLNDKWLIHGIGSIDSFTADNPEYFMDSLTTELIYYRHFNYDTMGDLTTVEYYDYDADSGKILEYEILQTPYNWLIDSE